MSDFLMQADMTDLASPKIEKLKKNVGEVSKQSNILAGAFGDLKSKAEELGVPLQKMETYFGKINPVMLGSVAAIGAVVGGLAAMTFHAIEVGAHLQDLSDSTGLSAQSLSSMRNVLAASEMDVTGYAGAIAKMSVKLGENGEYFKKLGVDIRDPEHAFDQLKHKIADIENPMQRAQLANKAFGKSYKELMPLLMMGNEQYDKMKGSTTVYSEEFIQNAARVDDNIALLKTSFSDFAVQLGANFIPMMESLVGILQEAADYWGKFGSGPDKQTKRAQDMSDISARYGALQAESDKGAGVMGEKGHRVKIDGKTLMEALQAYQDKARAEDKAEADSLAATKAKAEANRKAADLAEKLAAEQERRAKLILDNSFGVYSQKRDESNYASQQAYNNANRYDDAHNVNTSYFANGTEMRDYQSYVFNPKQDQEFYKNKHKEALANTAEFDTNAKVGEDAYNQQKITDAIKAQNEELDKQEKLYADISGRVENSLVGPFDSFYKSIAEGNGSLASQFDNLFSNIGKSFENMLTQMMAQLTAKAAIFGLLNILSGGGVGFATKALGNFSWFANGTDYAYGGAAIINERSGSGREVVNLPRGASVTPANRSNGGITNYNLNINGSNLGRKEIKNTVIDGFQSIQKENEWRMAN